MERTLGVSIYPGLPGAEVDVPRYLETAAALGYREVFTSLHIPESSTGSAAGALAGVARVARALGMSVWADIAPPALASLGATPSDLGPLAALGLTAIRVDYGYDPEAIAAMTRNPYGLEIVLNASTVRPGELEQILAAGARPERIAACHNFYPRPETGLSPAWFRQTSAVFTARGLRVAAFIPSRAGRRPPLYEGLPTLERHRHLDPARAAAEFLALGHVHTLFFGDPGATEEELASVRDVWLGDGVPLRVCLAPGVSPEERAILLGGVHVNRDDPAEAVIRSTGSRAYAARGPAIAPREPRPRPRGTVTIDNARYLRYSGELQITLRDLPPDPRVNVVGRVVEEDRPLLEYLGPGARFRFIPVPAAGAHGAGPGSGGS